MNPALRASDEDRQRVVNALERHTAAGRLRLDEFDSRVAATLDAVTMGELAAVTNDLPVEPASAGPDPEEHHRTGARQLLLAYMLAVIVLVILAVALGIAR